MPATRPLFFGPTDRRLFGWFHPAASARADPPKAGGAHSEDSAPPEAVAPEARADAGLVIASPFGYEAICANRSLRHFAEAAAAAGIPALRFDHDGTGDSIGSDRDPDRMGAWVAGIHRAAEELRLLADVQRVFLLGVRLGAVLAALAAAERQDVAGLIAIAPVVSGRAYVRELRALQMALALAPPPPGVKPSPENEQEAVGFVLAAETREALGRLELAKLPGRPAAEVLILDRADLPTAGKWRDQLSAQGAAVDLRQMRGYVEMVLDPHNTVVPVDMIRAAVDWMKDRAVRPADTPPPSERAQSVAMGPQAAPNLSSSAWGSGSPTASSAPNPGAPGAPSSVAHRIEACADAGVVERAELLDQRVRLFGVVSSPPPGTKPSGMSALLLNAGAVPHVGPNRLHVVLARRLAALGYTVLRMDLAGLGDSPPRPGIPENTVYSSAAMDDVLAGVAHLSFRTGGAPCAVVGLCSGAYHAFKAAVKGLPIARAVAINPLTFFWKPDMPLDVTATHRVVSESSRVMESATSAAAWRKVLSGKVNVRSAARVVGLRAVAELESVGRRAARRVGIPLTDDLPSELLTAARHGVDLRFVFAGDDPGLSLLRMLGGSTVRRLQDQRRLHIRIIPGPDHTFTQVWAHEPLLALLVSQVTAPLAR